jgi:hypothetical protein
LRSDRDRYSSGVTQRSRCSNESYREAPCRRVRPSGHGDTLRRSWSKVQSRRVSRDPGRKATDRNRHRASKRIQSCCRNAHLRTSRSRRKAK